MLTSDELQKLAEEAEERAKETRRANYINAYAPKPAIISIHVDGIFALIAASNAVCFIIWPEYPPIFIPIMMIMVVLFEFIFWLQARYRKKVRKAEAEFNELIKKENLKFRTRN